MGYVGKGNIDIKISTETREKGIIVEIKQNYREILRFHCSTNKIIVKYYVFTAPPTKLS